MEIFQEEHVDTRHVSDLMAGQVLVLSLRLEFLVCVPVRIFVSVHTRRLCVCMCGIECRRCRSASDACDACARSKCT